MKIQFRRWTDAFAEFSGFATDYHAMKTRAYAFRLNVLIKKKFEMGQTLALTKSVLLFKQEYKEIIDIEGSDSLEVSKFTNTINQIDTIQNHLIMKNISYTKEHKKLINQKEVLYLQLEKMIKEQLIEDSRLITYDDFLDE